MKILKTDCHKVIFLLNQEVLKRRKENIYGVLDYQENYAQIINLLNYFIFSANSLMRSVSIFGSL